MRSRVMIACVVIAGSPSQARSASEPVIGPGQEALLGAMLGSDGAALPGDCRLEEAKIEKAFVDAAYRCGADKRKEVVRLRHPDAVKKPQARTRQFALSSDSAPPELIAVLADRIRSREANWKWTVPVAGKPDRFSSGAPLAGGPPSTWAPPIEEILDDPSLSFVAAADGGAARAPDVDADFQKGLALVRQGKHADAVALLQTLARRDARHGVLGLLAAAIAHLRPGRPQVQQLAAAADATPDDAIAQFVAGVAAHGYAHQGATDTAEQGRSFRNAVRLLARANPALAFEPRLFVYLAASHFRIGEQVDAEQLVEKAIALGDDPDAFYCRAQIAMGSDSERALRDLHSWLAAVERQRQSGVELSAEKRAQIGRLRNALDAVAGGKIAAGQLFEVNADGSGAAAEARPLRRALFWAAVAALVLSSLLTLVARKKKV